MELTYAGKKIRKRRRLSIFKILVVSILPLLFGGGFYCLLYFVINPHIGLINSVNENVIGILITILGSVIISLFTSLIYYAILNKKYHEFYLKLLKDESMLDGLSLFEIKPEFNEVETSIIRNYLALEEFNVKYAFIQTNAMAYFELYQLNYGTNQKAVIIKTKVDFPNEEVIIIRNDARKGKLTYEDKLLRQYGFASQVMNVHKFALYSTMGNKIYQYINNAALEELGKFNSFCHAPLAIVLIDDNLLVLIDGWEMDIKKSLFNRDGDMIIDAQIEALKMLQDYIEKTMLLINTEHKEE